MNFFTSAFGKTPGDAVAAADQLVIHFRLFNKHLEGDCAKPCEWCARAAEEEK